MADNVRRRRHGLRTTFLRVAQVAIDGEQPEIPAAAGEVRIVGTPANRQQALDRVRAVAAAAHGVPVSGFSLADLEQLSAVEGVTLRSLLEALCDAGLELVAEAPFDRLQDARRSIEEVNISGLALARLTIHQLPASGALPLFQRIAALQRRVGVLRSFAPLARTMNPAVPTTGYDDVKRVALARLVVDNIPSIQVDWSLYGPKLAQVVLTMGADDVDGVSVSAGESGEGRRRAPLEEIRRNIQAAGHEPLERNGRFDLVSGGEYQALGSAAVDAGPAQA
jgi:aminodeoxyfutalosine synthase